MSDDRLTERGVPGDRGRVITAHAPSYPRFVRRLAGDALTVTSRPETYPGWIWCRGSDGVTSWVPERFLDVDGETATLRRDYDAAEPPSHV